MTASRILEALAYDHVLRKEMKESELVINYTPSTGNVFLSDNVFNIWVLKGRKLELLEKEKS
jgi:hypothetical protein